MQIGVARLSDSGYKDEPSAKASKEAITLTIFALLTNRMY